MTKKRKKKAKSRGGTKKKRTAHKLLTEIAEASRKSGVPMFIKKKEES